jgi:hypothetical protein
LLTDYNPRCLPEWAEEELLHKCTDADSKPFRKARGYLLAEQRNGTHHGNGRAGHEGAADPPPASGGRRDSGPDLGSGDIHLTDYGNAIRMVRDHGEDLRHCHPGESGWPGTARAGARTTPRPQSAAASGRSAGSSTTR